MKRGKRLFTIIFSFLMGIFMVGVASFSPMCRTSSSSPNLVVAKSGKDFIIEKNDIESVKVVSNSGLNTFEDDVVMLSVDVYPSVAFETVQSITYKIVDGEEYANIVGNKLIPNPDSIGKSVKVSATVDGVKSQNILEITIVPRPVQKIELVDFPDELLQSSALQLKTQVYPANATNKNLVYTVLEGEEYIKVNHNGLITVASELPEDKILGKISISSESNPEVVLEKEFMLHKPEIGVISAGSNLTEVEQQGEYSFAASISSDGETTTDKAIYSIDVSADIATIDENGVLKVSSTAPIGSKITVSISSESGASHIQTVTVKNVYATSMVVSNYTAPNESGKYLPETKIDFEVMFPTPFNVSDENKNFTISVNDTTLARVEGNSIVISSADDIILENPKFTATISSNQNGNILTQDIEFEIFVPVREVVLSKKENTVKENTTYNFGELVSALVYPTNSTLKNVTYKLDNEEFATISGNKLIVKDNLPTGNLSLKVYASIYGVDSNVVSFDIYKPTRSLELSANNLSPVSSKLSGEAIILNTITSETASANSPTISIVKGAENIAGNFSNGDEIGTQFGVKNNLASMSNLNKEIVLKAVQDEVESLLTIEVYIANEDVKIIANNINRGESNSFKIENTKFANNVNFELVGNVSDYEYVESIDFGSKTIKVRKDTPAGTEVSVSFRSLDKLGTVFTHTFTVAELGNFETEYIESESTKSQEKFNVIFGKDSSNIKLRGLNPQLYVGRSTNLLINFKGFNLSDYGMYISGYEILSSSATMNVIDANNICVSLPVDASGKEIIRANIFVKDGEKQQPYTLSVSIHAYKYLDGDVEAKLEGGIASYQYELITIVPGKNFDNKATEGLGGLKITPLSEIGASVGQDKLLKVSKLTANRNQTFRVDMTQHYNYETRDYARNVSLTLKTFNVDNRGGNGISQIAAIQNAEACKTLEGNVPTKTGYIFAGYYVSGSNACVFGANQRLDANFNYSSYADGTTIYATWTPITYTVTFIRGTDSATLHSGTYYYDQEDAYYNAPDVGGHTFSSWTISGYGSSGDRNLKIHKLSISNGDSITATCNYTKNPDKCVASGTLITLADGSQVPVEELKGDEMLLVWNLFTGKFDTAPILFVDSHGVGEYLVTSLTFSDGTVVKVIGDHGFFDMDLGKYVYITADNFDEYVGHWFSKEYTDENGELKTTNIQLVKGENNTEITNSYSPVTFSLLCYYVDGILSVPSETDGLTNYFVVDTNSMIYDAELLQADIEKYGLFDYEKDFAEIIPIEMFEAFNGTYLKVSVGKGLLSYEQINYLIEKYTAFFEKGEQCV